MTSRKAARVLLSRAELAARLNFSAHTLRKWEREGLPVARRGQPGSKVHPSLFREADVRAWLATRDAARSEVTAASARKERAQAILVEQLVASRARELLPRAEVERVWAGERRRIRARLMRAATEWAHELAPIAATKDVGAYEREMGKRVRTLLTELASGK